MSNPLDPLVLIHELEQRDRDHARPAGPPMWGPHVEQPAFWQVTGLARFWEGDKEHKASGEIDYAQHLCDLLAGLHTPGRPVRCRHSAPASGDRAELALHTKSAGPTVTAGIVVSPSRAARRRWT